MPTDYEEVLQEVMRIMTEGGQLIVCESFNRWISKGIYLSEVLKKVGFEIRKNPDENSDEVFQYIVCMKPIVEV